MSTRADKPNGWLRLIAAILRPLLLVVTRRRWFGYENFPSTGGVILVCNHISYADPLVIAHYVYDRPRVPRFLAKDGLFNVPVVGFLLRKCGQIPVYRHTTQAADSLTAAAAAIDAGGAVVIYPEGTRTEDRELWPMRGKTGAARLALTTQAPVIPVAQWGAQDIHHRFTGKLRLWRVPVSVAAGPAIDLSGFYDQPVTAELLAQVTETIMLRLRNDIARLRGVPAPAGPLVEPYRFTGPAQ